MSYNTSAKTRAENILNGEHKLRKMTERIEQNSQLSGGFFLFIGQLSGARETKIVVKFAWEMNDGTYAISSLPLEKNRMKFNESAEVPTVKFQWEKYGHSRELQTLIDESVEFMLITCKESDWPVNVKLPMNQK